MSDKETTIQELKDLLEQFKKERNWDQFHDAKNLAEAIAIEAGELQELFLWQHAHDVMQKIKEDVDFKEEVGDELADVIAFCLHFANATDIDVSSVVKDKMIKSGKKYPIEKSKNVATKYTKL